MFTVSLIFIVLLVIIHSVSAVTFMNHIGINKYAKMIVIIGTIPVMLACVWMSLMAEELDMIGEKPSKEEPKYQLIEEPVYRKIK